MFKRISKIFKGFMSLFIKNIETKNPEALLEAQREELREKVSQFNTNLAKQAGFVARLERFVAEREKKEKELLAKAQVNLKAGNMDIAGKAAAERKNILAELEQYKAQLVTAKQSYQNLVRTKDVTIKEAKSKLEALQQKLSQVKMKEAEAELQEMSQSMVGELGAGGDTMNRLEEQLNERLELATGKAQVAKDSADFSDIVMKESEQKALENQALAELAASMGMDYSPYGPAPVAEKSMGPQEGLSLQKDTQLDII